MICSMSPKFTAVTMSTVLVVSLVLSSPQLIEKVFAQQQQQQQPPPQQQPNVRAPLSNLTASIPLAPSLFEVLKSKVKVNISQAIDNVTKSLGPNSTAISASFQVVNGFLVYRVVILDSANNIHVILVDPANGSILSRQQQSAGRIGPFSFIPGASSSTSGVSRTASPTSTLPRQQQPQQQQQQQQQATGTGGPFSFIPGTG